MTEILPSGRPAQKTGPQGIVPEPEDRLRRDGFSLGEWQVEPRRQRIVSEGAVKRLDPKLIDVLIALAIVPGEVLTRDELLESVWGETFVNENSLSQAISRLRRALGDDPSEPRYIETISKSGYRLATPVGPPEPAADGDVQLPSREATPEPGATVTPKKPMLIWVPVAALAALVMGLVATRSGSPSPPVALVRPELTLVGPQASPRLSPDSSHVAFSWQGNDQTNWDIWVQAVGGDNPVRVTDNPDEEHLPAWSPDGERLAFVRLSPERQECGIFAMPVLGGAAERLGDCTTGMRSLSWSPDGQSLAHDGYFAQGIPTRALFLLDLGTGESRQLTTPPEGTPGDKGVRYSPDGKLLAFEREVSAFRDDVAVMSPADGKIRTLTTDRWGQIRGVDWTSDGAAVVFSSNRVGQFALWKVALTGDKPEPIPIHDSWVTQPSTSQAGGRLIYRTFRDSIDLWELPLDDEGAVAGEPHRRMPSSRTESQPAWSPAGDAIAFISDRSGSVELWSGKPDGSELIRHTDLRGPLPGSPVWSPDGRRILYDTAVDGQSDLWIVDSQSRRPRRFTHNASDDRNGNFSSAGSHVYFASNRAGPWDIWIMPATGGEARRVTTDGGFLAQESVDGNQLYYARLEQPGIWRMPTAGGEPEIFLTGLDLSDWGSWVVAEDGIYYLHRNPKTINFAGFDGSPQRLVLAPEKQIPFLGRALSYSAERQTLLFSLIDHSDDEVMTVDLLGL